LITKEEIEIKSNEFEIHTSAVQRDYVFGWFLVGLYSLSDLKNHLILKGGNCLRKAYLENTRFSSDLDFSTQSPLSEIFIGQEFNNICEFIQTMTGIAFDKDKTKVNQKARVQTDKVVYEAKVYFKDFYGTESKIIISIRMDITNFDKIYLPLQKRFLIHPYSDVEKCRVEITCVKLEEILASKLKCLLQREHINDFYDYAHVILAEHNLNLNKFEIVSTFLKLTIFQKSPGFVKKLLIDLPFESLRVLWAKYIIAPKLGIISFDKAFTRFLDSVNELFGNYTETHSDDLFYPSNYRNIIMEAGRSMTLLEIIYHGHKRLVEPYALTFKVRKDGIGQEYFYAYDLTGGNSGVGIKSLLHNNIQSINNTKTKFEPRYEVEVSKAGEYLKNSYFGKSFSSLKSPSNYIPTPIHIYECTICNKRFRKSKIGSKLNKHKDNYGNVCLGNFGLFLETIHN
jgi:predicted nucleotidyltransferase component of viral defense system